jgi:hypothetical protein
MVEAARIVVRYGEKLGEFYGRVKSCRGGSKAVVAVANKLLKVVWVMFVRREPYGGVNERLYEGKLNRVGFDM